MILNTNDLIKIVEGCKKNDRKSQRLLYEAYYARFMNVTLRYIKEPEEAKECLNQAFLRIFKKIDLYTETGSFEGWMNRIIVRQALSCVKDDAKKRNIKNTFGLGFLECADTIKTDSPLLVKEILNEVDKLPKKTREVFLDYLDGKKYKQISNERGISEGTSKWHVFEARATMKKRLRLLGI